MVARSGGRDPCEPARVSEKQPQAGPRFPGVRAPQPLLDPEAELPPPLGRMTGAGQQAGLVGFDRCDDLPAGEPAEDLVANVRSAGDAVHDA